MPGFPWDVSWQRSLIVHGGAIFFVDSTQANAVDNLSNGYQPTNPYATLSYALARPTASKNDVIYVMPGHAETVPTAAGINFNIAGVRVIGLGDGRNRPLITLGTAASASIDVNAANCGMHNIGVVATNVASTTAAMNIKAADFQLGSVQYGGCEFQLANATNQAVLGVLTTAAASGLVVRACRFIDTTGASLTAGTTAAIRIVGGDRITIGGLFGSDGNYFYGAYSATVGCIENLTTDTTNCIIAGNFLLNGSTNASAKVISMRTAATGGFANNRISILGAGTAPVTFAGGNNLGGNYYSSAVGVAAATLL